MDTSTIILQGLVISLILANLAVSIAVIISRFYSQYQKLAQCLIVWLLPGVGATAIWFFLRAQYNWEKFDTRAYPERSKKMVAVEVNNAIHDHFGEGGGD